MLTLDITPLAPGLHELALEPTPEDLLLAAEDFDQITVNLRLDYQPHRLIVQLGIAALASLECDRTLETYQERVGGEHAVAFLPPEQVPDDPEGLGEDVRPLPEPGTPIDITDVARDTLLLALPVRRVAPGAEERDIDLVFGEADDHTDPRWDALRDLDDDN